MKPTTPLIQRNGFRFVMAWLFVISILAALPICYFTASTDAMLGSICFFGLMLTYQVIEAGYDDRRAKKIVADFELTKNSLGIGISQGTVKMIAGGVRFQEGIDYTVDYASGKIIILNLSLLNSGKNIIIQYEYDPKLDQL